jgi:AcrR family transcriptional regulator
VTTPTGRQYRSPRRAEQAAQTRAVIVAAATELFLRDGWRATTVAAVAARAGVVLDTIYTGFGSKAGLLIAAKNAARDAEEAELPFFDRPSFRALGEGTIEQRVASTAALLTTLNERTWPLDEVWRDAAAFEPDLARQHADREEDRRIQTARALELLTGRPPGPIAADGIWAITGSAVYAKLVNGAGWTRDLYQSWLMSTILGMLDADGRAG